SPDPSAHASPTGINGRASESRDLLSGVASDAAELSASPVSPAEGVATPLRVDSRKERCDAQQACERQEREAVREAEGKGDVEGAGGEDLQLAGLVESRRQEVRLQLLALELEARRHDRPEEGRGPEGRQGVGPKVLTGKRRGRP